eukprot:5109830-Alexandrium_andersonii.AAC.1
MQSIAEDPMYRRYCGLLDRNPTLQGKDRRKAGQVAPWNWLEPDDVPPPQKASAHERREDEDHRNQFVDAYLGSGYAAAPDVIETWNLRHQDNPQFEDEFTEWGKVKHRAWETQRLGQINALYRNVENVGVGT